MINNKSYEIMQDALLEIVSSKTSHKNAFELRALARLALKRVDEEENLEEVRLLEIEDDFAGEELGERQDSCSLDGECESCQ